MFEQLASVTAQTRLLEKERVAVQLEHTRGLVASARAQHLPEGEEHEDWQQVEADEAESMLLMEESHDDSPLRLSRGQAQEVLIELEGVGRTFSKSENLALRIIEDSLGPRTTVVLEARLRYAFELRNHTFVGSFALLKKKMRGHLTYADGSKLDPKVVFAVQLSNDYTEMVESDAGGLGSVRVKGRIEVAVRFQEPLDEEALARKVEGLTLCLESEPGVPSPYGAALRDPKLHGNLLVRRID